MGHFRHQYRTENVKVMIHAYELILDYICFFWFFRHSLVDRHVRQAYDSLDESEGDEGCEGQPEEVGIHERG